jgi:hypothetical protein
VRDVGTRTAEDSVPEAYEEHDVVALVLDQLPELDVDDERCRAQPTVPDEVVEQHVEKKSRKSRAPRSCGPNARGARSRNGVAGEWHGRGAPEGKTMKKLCVLSLAVALGGWSVAATWAAGPSTTGEAAEKAPDNTGRNVRDRGDTVTSGDQSESKADLATTQKIRQAVVADDSLSTNAHNVKIITTSDGAVTLRGPVKSEEERKKIGAMAEQVAGTGRVQNQLEVAPPK